MPRLQPPEPTQITDAVPGRDQVVGKCRDMLELAHRDPTFAKYFVEEVCAPAKYNERPFRTSVIGGGTRWEFPYLNRVVQSLDTYLGMSDEQRQMLHAGLEDGVQWRGEPVATYVRVFEETARMRQAESPVAYMREAVERVKQLRRRQSGRE